MSGLLSSWKIALRNLTRNKRRNVATGLAIAIGFAALLAIGGYVNCVANYLRVQTVYASRGGHLSLYQKGGLENYSIKPSKFSLSPKEQALITAALQDTENVEFFAAQLFGTGLIGNGCKTLPFVAIGIEPETEKRLRQHPEIRRWLPELQHYIKGRGLADYPQDFEAIVLSQGLARLLGKTKVLDDFQGGDIPVVTADCQAVDAAQQLAADANIQLVTETWNGMMSALDGEVVAQYTTGLVETNNTALVSPLAYLQKLYETDDITSVSVWLKDPSKLQETRQALQRRLKSAGLDLEVYSWTDERVSPFYAGIMSFLQTLAGFVGVILVSIVVFSIFNAVTMTIIERTQEIGMMRSLGYTQRHIRLLFVREILALTGISLLAGGIAAALGLTMINHANIRFHAPSFANDVQLQLIPTGVVILVSALSILMLAVITTFFAVRAMTRRNIAILLQGASY